MIVHADCRHFRGDVPCKPHKEDGVHCDGCGFCEKTGKRVIIIKLGAIGDVIRTTPLMHRLKEEYPDSEVTWLTLSPEVVPSVVDRVLGFELKSVVSLLADSFDMVFSLDKDAEACALASMIKAQRLEGFTLKEGKCAPVGERAEHKWLTGLFDDLNRANTKSYPEEVFDICGFEFKGEKYILDSPPEFTDAELGAAPSGPLVGLNTGCGGRWTTRLWPLENWVDLIEGLKGEGLSVVLLGGPDEDLKNRELAARTDVLYPGHFPLKGCFKQRFDAGCEVPNCMEFIKPEAVFGAIKEML